MIISTGMSTLKEVEKSIGFIKSRGNNKIVALHCTTNYPCPPKDANISVIKTMMKKLNIPIGYSDHTQGNIAAITSVAIGIAAYEFHITIDKSLPGPDHIASSDLREARERIEAIRRTEVIMGNPIKKPSFSERVIAKQVRRHLVASHELKKGDVLALKDLEALRPEKGTPVTLFEKFIGKKIKKNVKKAESIDNRIIF